MVRLASPTTLLTCICASSLWRFGVTARQLPRDTAANTSSGSESPSLSTLTTGLPACAYKCATAVPPQVLTNPSLLCDDKSLLNDLSTCLILQCTLEDLLKSPLSFAELCPNRKVDRSRNHAARAASIVICVLAWLIVLVRCFARWKVVHTLSADDMVMIATLVPVTSFFAVLIAATAHQFGYNNVDIDFHNVKILLKFTLAQSVLYIIAISMVKISILLFQLRVFPKPQFRRVAYGVLAWISAYIVAISLAFVFQCTPPEAAWSPKRSARCINLFALFYAAAAMGIAQDIAIILLPLSQLRTLQVPRRKKLELSVVFGFGIVSIVAAIVRLVALVRLEHKTDQSYGGVPAILWAYAEILTAMICGSLPAYRPLFSYVTDPIRSLISRYTSTTASSHASSPHATETEGKSRSSGGSSTVKRSIVPGRALLGGATTKRSYGVGLYPMPSSDDVELTGKESIDSISSLPSRG